jgi:hypothetical protein
LALAKKKRQQQTSPASVGRILLFIFLCFGVIAF